MSPSLDLVKSNLQKADDHSHNESRRAQGDNSTVLEFFKHIQQELEEELRAIPDLQTDNSSNDETFDQHLELIDLVGVSTEDKIPYSYPKYNYEADAEAHVRAFLRTWQANHVSQRLSKANIDISKIAEFKLLLEGKSG